MPEETILARFGTQGEDALMRFMTNLAGSAEKLKMLETGAYAASKASTLFSQSLWTHPITTLRAFSASTEKAAIATGYFREQLAFLAASRFGSILLWGSILGGITATIHKTIQANIEMDNAVHRVSSAFIEMSNISSYYGEIQDKLTIGAIRYGQTYKEVAEVMWELKSAGLSVKETYAGMESVQKLLLSGATDLNMTSRMMAGLYRAFGKEMKGANTEQERFAELAGGVTYALNQSQANLDDLMQSYKYAMGTSKQMGLSFAELTAVIQVGNNAMLFGSTIGTGFAQALVNIAKNWRKFAKDFDIAIDPNKTLSFIDFVNQLAKNQDLLNSKIGAMATLSEDSNMRAMRALLASVQGVDELNAAYKRLSEGGLQQYIDKTSGEKMDTLEQQFKRLGNSIKSNFLVESWVDGVKQLIREQTNLMEASKLLAIEYQRQGKSFPTTQAHLMVSLWQLMGKSETEILEITKKLSEQKPMEGLSKGTEKATQQAKELFTSFTQILTQEEKERFFLLNNNELLEEKLKKVEKQLEITKQLAIDEASANLNSKQTIEAKEKAFKLEEQRLTIIKQIAQQTEKAKTNALENLASMEAFREKILSIKALNPAEQIERNNTALAAAKVRLEAATVGTKEWRTATKDLGEHVAKALGNYILVDNAINKARDSQEKFNQAVIEMAEKKAAKGEGFQAEQIIRQRIEELDFQRAFTREIEKELPIINEMIKMGEAGLKIKADDYQLGRRMEELQARKFDITKKMASEDMDAAEKAKRAWDSTQKDTEKFATEVAEAFKNYPTSIREASELLNKDLNAGLVTTKQLIIDATKEMVALANAIGGAGQNLRDMEKEMEREDRRV